MLARSSTCVSDTENMIATDAVCEASADTFQIGSEDNTPFVCQYCQKALKSKGGLTIHLRKMHEENFHATNVPLPRIKARWDDEEYVLLAREEVRLTKQGVKNINKELTKVLPHRSLQSIKGVRRTSNKRYQSLLLEFRTLPEVNSPPLPDYSQHARGGTPADVGSFPQRRLSTEEAFCDLHHESWWARIKESIHGFGFLSGLDADSILPDCLSDEVRQLIDMDFNLWMELMTAIVGVVPPRRKKRGPGRTGGNQPILARAVGVESDGPGKPGRNKRPRRRLAQKKRKAAYKKLQHLFVNNKARCAQEVLGGSWDRPTLRLSLEELEPFWREIFEHESLVDNRAPDPIGPVLWHVINPVTQEELRVTLKAMKAGAPGPDGMVLSQLLKLPMEELVARLNLWLMAGYCPVMCCMGETVLIPKDQSDISPPKHRPITMANMIIRCFHKLMAKRMGDSMPFSDRQKAFRSGDGLAENVVLLRAIIKHHTDNKLPLNVVFLDIAKAFDSVSHQSILIAAKRMGIPAPFLTYLHEFYSRSQTRIRVAGQKSEPISVRRGVKQGDPMSVHLFNAVIDWALSTLDPNLGIDIGGVALNHLAFADDIGLLTRTSVGAQSQIDRLNDHLSKCGLTISAGSSGKSASMRIDVDGKRKCWVVNPNDHLHVAGIGIPAKSIKQVYCYLGIPFSAKGPILDVAHKLQGYLDNLSRAPLKPQQRMYILRRHVLSSLYHQLVLTNCAKKLLVFLDIKIRGAVRRWLRLPKDTSNFFIHAPVAEGGLGVAILENAIPLMRKARLEKLLACSDPAVVAVVGSSRIADMLSRGSVPLQVAETAVCDKNGLKRALARGLHHSVDGRGLSQSRHVPSVNKWVDFPTHVMSGANYIGAIKIRGNLMATAARMARGRPQRDVACDACGRPESLGHILQVCPRTSGARIDRHNSVLARTVKLLIKNNWSVLVEPGIPTPAGLRRPDIIVWNGDSTCYVIDVTVAADNADLNAVHRRKVEYYNTEHVCNWAARVSGAASVTVSSISFNWRGSLAVPSHNLLRGSLAIRERDVQLLGLIVMEKGYKCWLDFKKSTYRCQTRRDDNEHYEND